MNKVIYLQCGSNTIFSIQGNCEFELFTEIDIIFDPFNRKIVVYSDFLIEGLQSLIILLDKASKSNLAAPFINAGIFMGVLWGDYCQDIVHEEENSIDLISSHNVWQTDDSIGVATWIYNFDQGIRFEIGHTYPWHYEDLPENKQTYEEYRSDYQPITVFEIDKNIALTWINQCQEILEHCFKIYNANRS